ncbi:MAG TPA: SOS response-associated peptidase [Candidatus Nitrosocosmicus sp.]|nr:SOS response-associated peptidase [Candidatus Nitrosocosmicus sp.]
MCGAFGFSGFSGSINVQLRYELNNKPHVRDSYNIRPSMDALVVTRNSPNTGKILKFGIKAPWDERQLLINAKSETAAELRSFKTLFHESRCLIPASHFFEWQRGEDHKIPFCIKLKTERVFSFAGLHNEEGFVILTTSPNSLMKPIHSRMPCILDPDNEDDWLNPDTDIDKLQEMLHPYNPKDMDAYEVSTAVNSSKSQSEEVVKPV